jgi:hypothetical protein
MKKLIRKLIRTLGYDLVKHESFAGSYDPYTEIRLSTKAIPDLEALANIATTIPGMITPKSGQLLFTMCYLQDLKGDVVEIGSWQGRSTSFLARAVKESGNGRFFAIDHFKGNVGKENRYVVGKEDLSDLESGFLSNMKRLKLDDSVSLMAMANESAAAKIDENVRFLFIDGDHTKKGVEKDIEL